MLIVSRGFSMLFIVLFGFNGTSSTAEDHKFGPLKVRPFIHNESNHDYESGS